MSDVAQGPGWWIASDGKWYPPELHPSVRDDQGQSSVQTTTQTSTGGQPGQMDHVSNGSAHFGSGKPDLFKKAMAGSSLADAVHVKYDAASGRGEHAFSGQQVGANFTSTRADGSGSRRKRRRGH